jgi:hypothetical protein
MSSTSSSASSPPMQAKPKGEGKHERNETSKRRENRGTAYLSRFMGELATLTPQESGPVYAKLRALLGISHAIPAPTPVERVQKKPKSGPKVSTAQQGAQELNKLWHNTPEFKKFEEYGTTISQMKKAGTLKSDDPLIALYKKAQEEAFQRKSLLREQTTTAKPGSTKKDSHSESSSSASSAAAKPAKPVSARTTWADSTSQQDQDF